MWRYAVFVLVLALAEPRLAAAQRGTNEIQQLAGCFEVSYRFAEDGSRDIFSGLTTEAKEWVGFERRGENEFLLQHRLIVDSSSFPHWYETWSRHPDMQAWTQEVRGGAPGSDSELRYTCTAPWTANRWECHAARSEKPLRDQERDYDWIDRKNTLLVTPKGWVQNEHNIKMHSSGQPASYELGWIVYRRVEEQQCGTAPEQFPKDIQTLP